VYQRCRKNCDEHGGAGGLRLAGDADRHIGSVSRKQRFFDMATWSDYCVTTGLVSGLIAAV